MRVPTTTDVPTSSRPQSKSHADPFAELPTPESFCCNAVLTRHVVPAAHGYAFAVTKGTRFRIIDLKGEQVVDFMAWVHDKPFTRLEKMSTAYTRYHLSGVQPAVGESLWTNADRPLLRVTADTVKVHDMTFMSCFPGLYTKQGLQGHRSCAQNIFEAMQSFGMEDILDIAEPFNIFQNTPNYSLKRLGSSKPGDYIEFEALEDAVCAVSSCPYDLDGFNGGVITDIAVVIAKKK
ncbi:hypothetical protein K491DRAFT_259376 [Lophiostoma macrostomum CBS 122681]|uniref:DUF1989 domain-containing protein n=1 Tax=Lophiostoma macrostomum CBS 122681 TaxID=1314788 RepID=A0A6A6TFQ1_9PLEO|nr:hypothetical protein K491DRAFT_259376 [Lophiostoma macrostomum CBS 122681]